MIGMVMPTMSASWKASVPITAGDLAGDGDHRHGVHVGVHDGGNEVGGTGAGGGDADADPSGDHGVALRGVAGSLFVTDQNVVHSVEAIKGS